MKKIYSIQYIIYTNHVNIIAETEEEAIMKLNIECNPQDLKINDVDTKVLCTKVLEEG